jgi:hypothetical protein
MNSNETDIERQKQLLKFQVERKAPFSFYCLPEKKKRKNKQTLNVLSFRKNILLVSQTFKIMLAKEVTVNAWVKSFFRSHMKKKNRPVQF